MTYRVSAAAPASSLPEAQRGPVVGRYCFVCNQVFPTHRMRHVGRPVYGRDHIPSPCTHEGDAFGEVPAASDPWWDWAVDVKPAPPPPSASAPPPAGAVASPPPAPVKG